MKMISTLLNDIVNRFKTESWNDIDLVSGVTSKGNNGYRKTGNIVEVELSFTVSTANTNWKVISQNPLPTEYRPSHPVKMPIQANTATVMTAEVGTDGNISVYNNAVTSAWWFGRVMYVVGGGSQ